MPISFNSEWTGQSLNPEFLSCVMPAKDDPSKTIFAAFTERQVIMKNV